ncbi:MAG: M48 family metalloprotease [Verrucomicrobiota bacterium]
MREAFLRVDAVRQERLHRVAYPLLREAMKLFELEPRPVLGVLVLSADAFPAPYAELANEVWDLDRGPVLQAVAPGSPADAAGLRPGDRIVDLAGSEVAPADPGFREAFLTQIRGGRIVSFEVEREDQRLSFTITPASVAPYQVQLRYDSRINALATGRTVKINRGMLEFCSHDSELAFVIAHEIAHNALRHHRDHVLNYLAGTAVDVALLAAGVPSPNAFGLFSLFEPAPDFESEADLVALHLLDAAGYELEPLRDFWARFATLGPETRRRWWQLPLRTHPDFATRQLRMEAGIEAILNDE